MAKLMAAEVSPETKDLVDPGSLAGQFHANAFTPKTAARPDRQQVYFKNPV